MTFIGEVLQTVLGMWQAPGELLTIKCALQAVDPVKYVEGMPLSQGVSLITRIK